MLFMMGESDWTRVLGRPGYKVYRHEIDELGKRLKLWAWRRRGNKHPSCSGCGQLVRAIAASYEREVRDFPWSEYRTTVVLDIAVKMRRNEYSAAPENSKNEQCGSDAGRQQELRTSVSSPTETPGFRKSVFMIQKPSTNIVSRSLLPYWTAIHSEDWRTENLHLATA